MTTLKKPIHRTTQGSHYGRQLVVTLEPFDLITIRQKGRRTRYTLPLTAVYDLAGKVYAREAMKQKAAARKAARMERERQ